ncbi:hypothetical protein [Dokdonella sp.]|uniref:hypothetical protein n=1 Tax=Dokdonella sp. TaxID=2291710 RepID=UPI0025C6E432|nr:hypothetical protein [Dokdonella sp.]MBX3689220.1 hypothetical protein [Dokdonella sp.]
MLPSPTLSILAAVVIGALVYAWILDTSFLKGLLIGVIATVIGYAVFFLFASIFVAGLLAA